MSFLLELQVAGLTEEQGRAVEQACRERHTWPVHFKPRKRGRLGLGREVGPELWMPAALDSNRHLLIDEAEWNAPAWAMRPELLPSLAEAVRVLADYLTQGFAFRATWIGSELREERMLSADELADLILASRLNEFTRYHVRPRLPSLRG